MPLGNTPLDQITETQLQQVVTDRELEGVQLEYKERVDLSSADAKKEFLRDVSSFANTIGADLVIGIRCEDGRPVEVCGVECTNPDEEVRRLEQVIRDGLEPRLAGLRIRPVPLANSRHALVIRVPRSWAAPHRVAFQSTPQFWARRSTGKYSFDIHELRAAFTFAESTADRIRDFRLDRVAKIMAKDDPARLEDGPRTIVHLVPLGALRPGHICDLSALGEPLTSNLGSVRWSQYCRLGRFNLDGFLVTSSSPREIGRAYCQYFRSGIIESVDVESWREQIPYGHADKSLTEELPRLLSIEQRIGAQPPFVLMLTLTGVRGYVMGPRSNTDPWFAIDDCHKIDRDPLLIPDVLIESVPCDPLTVLKPVLDTFWNSAGYAGSLWLQADARDPRVAPRS